MLVASVLFIADNQVPRTPLTVDPDAHDSLNCSLFNRDVLETKISNVYSSYVREL